MTVIHPNAVSGINSVTVQNGNSLSIHKSDGSLIRTITGSTGVTTFATISVGRATTDFAQGGGINIGLGASISNGSGNVLPFGTGGDDRVTIDASGNFNVGTAATIKAGGNATFSGIVTATTYYGSGANLTGIEGGVTSDSQYNTVAGTNAGDSFTGTDANHNSLFGYNSGTAITTGDNNTFLGSQAGEANTTASNNVGVGRDALQTTTTGGDNVALGVGALENSTTASYNTALGRNALNANTTGPYSTAVGANA